VFSTIPGMRVVAVMDNNSDLLSKAASAWNASGYSKYDDFLADSDIDLVYIATPPYLHYEQSKQALLHGKHVICEKPAALRTKEAVELASLASSLNLLWVVNLMQRYNPMYDAVRVIIEKKLFGEFLHGFFENYASDEKLGVEHWFWDQQKSGGIFIEHAVHFFDMFSGWLGEGKILHAVELKKNGSPVIDRVQSTVLYNGGMVNFYHGFDQPDVLDRQEMRLQFERGEITLYGWIPVKIKLYGLLVKEEFDRLNELLPGASVVEQNGSATNKINGGSDQNRFNEPVTLEFGSLDDKGIRYESLLAAMIQDQWKWITDRSHERVITDQNGILSLKMAEESSLIAKQKS
jgi:predicted dehydrogenase